MQFVPYRETNNNPVKLAAELLAELPNQVVEYMVRNGLFRERRGLSRGRF